MRLKITHATQYAYAEPAQYALQQLRIRPHSSPRQEVLSWQVELTGAHLQAQFTDQHGNLVDLVEFEPGAAQIGVVVRGEVETADTSGIAGPHVQTMPLWFYLRQTALTAPGPQVAALIADMRDAGPSDLSALHELSGRIGKQVSYLPGETSVHTTAEQALKLGSGVCQDHTHVFLSAARSLGFPARYVSGYLMMNDRIDQDATHAWAEAHVDGLGWVGFDISNAISPDERYVQVARGLDYRGAAPTAGFVVGGRQEDLVVSVQVQQ